MLFFSHQHRWEPIQIRGRPRPQLLWYVGVPARDKHYFTTNFVVDAPASVVTVT